MRALFLSGATTWEGAVRVFSTVARALGERGHETWLAVPAGSEAARHAVERGARVIALPARRGIWSDSRHLRRELPKDFVDAVFVHAEHEQLTATWAVRAAKRGAVVRRLGAGERLESGWRARRAEQWLPVRYLYTSESPPTGHAAPSGSLSPMRAELGVEPGSTLPALRSRNGDADASRAPILVCVATRAALRRTTNVVRAAAMLAQRHEGLRLRVIGSVAADEELKLLAAALGIARRVEWLGHPRDLSLALHGAAAGWVIGDGDDAALGVLELMAHGVAVLAERTSIAGRYVNHGIQGTLMATLDPPLMAAETAILLADRERRVAMGAAGRARVEREFSQREMLASFELALRASRERAGA